MAPKDSSTVHVFPKLTLEIKYSFVKVGQYICILSYKGIQTEIIIFSLLLHNK